MPEERSIARVGERKVGVEINEYKGAISINSVRIGNNEVWYWNRCIPERFNENTKRFEFDTDAKPRPTSIYLGGSKEEALQTLRDIAIIVNGL